jgi:hypothetical protein
MTATGKDFDAKEVVFDHARTLSWAELRDAVDAYLRNNGIADSTPVFYIDVHMPYKSITVVVGTDGLEVTD